MAANGSDSTRMTRTISTSPSALIHRLNVTKGKSDQRTLARQNEKNTPESEGSFAGLPRPWRFSYTARSALLTVEQGRHSYQKDFPST